MGRGLWHSYHENSAHRHLDELRAVEEELRLGSQGASSNAGTGAMALASSGVQPQRKNDEMPLSAECLWKRD